MGQRGIVAGQCDHTAAGSKRQGNRSGAASERRTVPLLAEAATDNHSPGGATPPGTLGGSASTISSERPNSSMSAILRSAWVGSDLVRVQSAATRNLLLRPMVRIDSGKWRQMNRASLKNPTTFVRSARARKKA